METRLRAALAVAIMGSVWIFQAAAPEIRRGEYHCPHRIDLDAVTGRLAVTTDLPDQLLR
jgi:hypothetical protein